MRKSLLKYHSYLALVALIPLIIVSITGSLLVFKSEIDQWLMPAVAKLDYNPHQTRELTRSNHNHLQTHIEQTFPSFIIGAWEIFNDGKEADRVFLVKKGSHDWYKFHLDPFSGRILDQPAALESQLTDWLVSLHYTFLLNGIGHEDSQWGTFIGLLVALIFTFLGISGLIIHRKFWRQLFSLRRGRSVRVFSGDLHRLVGTWSSPIILVLGITGIYFNTIDYYHEVFEHGDEAHFQPQGKLYGNDINFYQLLLDSQQQLDQFTPTYLLYPYEPEVDITVFGFQPSANPFASKYSSTVTYQAENGQLVLAYDGRTAGAAAQVFDSFRELHFGSFAGLSSKVVWSFFGLAPTLLALTGFIVWWKRRSKRKGKRMKVKPQTA